MEAAEQKTFLVEHYWPGFTAEKFVAAAGLVRSCSEEMAREGVCIRYLHSTLVPEDEAAFCVFDAASIALIEDAYARAGVRFERVVGALEARALTTVNSQEPIRPQEVER